MATDAARFIFTTLRAGATGAVLIHCEIVQCNQSVPQRDPRLGFTEGSEAAGTAQQTSYTCPSYDPWIVKWSARAQQYLQALRECESPPPDLRDAWDAFYLACDPIVRGTVAACGIAPVDLEDGIQEAWTEIAAKLTRFEYDETRGSFASWLRIVVHRTACRHARRGLRQSAGRIDQDLAAVKCPRLLGPSMATQREELRASVRETLDAFRPSVSSTAFRILVMTAVQGRTSPEIGKLLGLTPGAVRVSHHRTARKFRQFVAGRPGLDDALGVSPPPNKAAEVRGNQRRLRPD